VGYARSRQRVREAELQKEESVTRESTRYLGLNVHGETSPRGTHFIDHVTWSSWRPGSDNSNVEVLDPLLKILDHETECSFQLGTPLQRQLGPFPLQDAVVLRSKALKLLEHVVQRELPNSDADLVRVPNMPRLSG
jgi:hypothetical protein